MDKKTPIFQAIFGKTWHNLPPVLQKHYANRPHSNDVVVVDGFMNVQVSLFAKILTPFFRLAGALVPYAGDNVPVTVTFRSEIDSDVYCFDRVFNFPDRPAYHFRSRMLPVGGNAVVELMPIGIGWHASYEFDGAKILIKHLGYKIKLGNKLFRLPLEFLLGRGYAEEEALDENNFRMYMEIKHKILGVIYVYKGNFQISAVNLDG